MQVQNEWAVICMEASSKLRLVHGAPAALLDIWGVGELAGCLRDCVFIKCSSFWVYQSMCNQLYWSVFGCLQDVCLYARCLPGSGVISDLFGF